jgi:aminoglycoside 3-N-acetyltransferase
MGVDHTVNTSIHYGEKLAGRRQFIRWALIPDRIVECPGFPGCSRGFEAIRPSLEAITRHIESGSAVVQAIPLSRLFEIVVETIKKDPLALLCQQDDCVRCNVIRKEIE